MRNEHPKVHIVIRRSIYTCLLQTDVTCMRDSEERDAGETGIKISIFMGKGGNWEIQGLKRS